MSLQPTWSMEIPPDTAELGWRLLPENNVYRLTGDEVNKVLHVDELYKMYSVSGRGAVHPVILALVTVFQFLENVPDRVAAEWAVIRLDWKYALHVPLDYQGFHHSTLSNFRKRVIAHGQEQLVFEQVLKWVQGHGFLKKRGKQRTDSTHILGCVARMSRLELMWETIRMALSTLQEICSEWYVQHIPAVFDEMYRERQSAWRLSAEEVETETEKAGTDGYWLLDLVMERGPVVARTLPEVAVLEQVLSQQYERQEGRVHARKPPIRGKKTVQSPHEPEARYSKKRGTEWVGYKVQVTETAYAEEANFVTDIDTVDANDDDSEVVDNIHARLEERDLKPQKHYVDKGYVSGDNIAHSAAREIELYGPIAADTSIKPQGFKQADFDLDFERQVATCPAGQTSVSWLERPQDDGSVGAHVLFRHICETCPHRTHCAPGSSGRSLEIHPHCAEIRARRDEMQTQDFKQEMKHRSAIEGTLSELVRKHGLRRARYRGKAKVRLQHLFTGAAVNLKRLSKALEARKQGKNALATGC